MFKSMRPDGPEEQAVFCAFLLQHAFMQSVCATHAMHVDINIHCEILHCPNAQILFF
jgi:hypothetical protein